MPMKRGHVAPQNTYIVTLMRSFDSQSDCFIMANAMFSTKPIIYCSESFSDLLGYTKPQLMLKSSKLNIFYGSQTTCESIRSLHNALSEPSETEVSISLRAKNATHMPFKITVTPVRDENGQLPIYLLFFQTSVKSCVPREVETKRLSLRSKLNIKSLRINRNMDDEPKFRFRSSSNVLNSAKVFTGQSSCINQVIYDDTNQIKKTTADVRCGQFTSVRRFFQKNAVNALGTNCDENEHNFLNASASILPCDATDETRNRLSYPVIRRKARGLQFSNEVYGRIRSASDEQDNTKPQGLTNGRPYSCRVGNHPNSTDSEALLLVLGDHPEPTKSSVTEKFAQFLSMDEDLHVEHRFQSPRMHRFTLKHYGMFKAVWDWIILISILYTAIVTPYTAVFDTASENKYLKVGAIFSSRSTKLSLSGDTSSNITYRGNSNTEYLRFADIIVDIMFFVDILINFRTTYVNKNDEVVSHPRRIATHYIKGWFIIDLIAAIPFDLFFWRTQGEQPTLMTNMLKAARLLRLVGIFRKLDRYSELGASILLLLAAMFALIAHWLACIWYAIGYNEQQHSPIKIGWLSTLANQTQEYYSDHPDSGPSLATKYITALYFTFSSLTSIGFGNISPNTDAEKIFSIVVMLVGSLMYASIFGNVGALILRLYSGTARYHAQMLRIKEFIRFHQIPSPLRQRLEEYSTQIWEHTNGIDMTMVQYSFPESLQSDITLFIYRDFLGGSSAFKSLNDGCLRNLSLRIRASHMPPSDTLIHVGDLLTAVYYVVKGTLEVVTTDDLIVGVLNPGDFFGGLPPLVHRRDRGSRQQSSECAAYHGQTRLRFSPAPAALGSHQSLSSLPALEIMQACPPPKCRFAIRALTYTDVQFIDRQDLADLCSVYPELPLQLLHQFELTLPLVSANRLKTNRSSCSHNRRSANKSVSNFLKSASIWNVAPASVMNSLIPVNPRVPLFGNFPDDESRMPHFNEICSPHQPFWELERLQRLFEHGGLSISADSTVSPVSPPVYPAVSQTSSVAKTLGQWNPVEMTRERLDGSSVASFEGQAPTSSGQHNLQSPSSPMSYAGLGRLCMGQDQAQCPSVSASTVDSTFAYDTHQLAFYPDAQLLHDLVSRVTCLEKHLRDLEGRVAITIGTIQTELLHLLPTTPASQ